MWSTMPEGMVSTEVLRAAIEQKVAFVPGGSFYARGGGINTMRLNFSNASPEKLRLGIERMGNVIKEQMTAKGLLQKG